MTIIWTNNAKEDLQNYKQNSKIININEYINSLINYIENLSDFSQLGKSLFKKNNMEFRQLIYKQHRIFYAISNDVIYILMIYHTSRNTENIIKYLKNKNFMEN